MMKFVVECGLQRGIPVSICGELAADVELVGLLLGLGLREFSVQPRAVGPVRKAIRGVELSEAEAAAGEALAHDATSRQGPARRVP